MKVLKIEQNSEEWLEFRKGKSGGSEFKDIWVEELPKKTDIIAKLEEDGQALPPADKRLGVAELARMLEPSELVELKLEGEPKLRYYEIIAERVAKPITPNDYVDRLDGVPFSMMARGHLLEKEALYGNAESGFEGFAKRFNKQLDEDSVVWVSDEDENVYISPDATITGADGKVREAVEVKCLANARVVKAYLTGKYPEEYHAQVVKYFVVNEDLETLYFVIYTDCIPGLELQVFEIHREDVKEEIADAKAFELAIMKRIDADVAKIESLGF